MAIVFNSDAGTISGLSVGGLPDGIVDAGTLATNSVDSAELVDSVQASTVPSGNPPTASPVTVPDPLITIAIRYSYNACASIIA